MAKKPLIWCSAFWTDSSGLLGNRRFLINIRRDNVLNPGIALKNIYQSVTYYLDLCLFVPGVE